MLIQYAHDDWTPQAATVAIIDRANAIITEYEDQGYTLTLRQLYYQFVARGFLDNTQRAYKNLGAIIAKARLAGMVSWRAMEDRTRNLQSWQVFPTAADAIAAARDTFTLDKWSRQPVYVEAWIEKEALAGVFERICGELEIPYFSCRGYVSLSELWSASQRLRRRARDGKEVHVLHFGDHDPSGIDMTRDIVDRLHTFGASVELARLALNMDQVREHNPPPNPAKLSDSRGAGYVDEYGYDSWELDALDPSVLAGLVRDAVEELRDDDLWEEARAEEDEALADLDRIVDDLGGAA